MKKILCLICLIALCACSCLLFSCGEGYSLSVLESSTAVLKDGAFVVESGELVSIPQAIVVDKDGNQVDGYTVKRVVTDEQGNIKSASLIMQHGDVYKVVYSASGEKQVSDLTYSIKCFDTVLPTLSLLDLKKSYSVGERVVVSVESVSSDIDYDNSTFIITFPNATEGVSIDFESGYEFVAETLGEYSVVGTLVDQNGNKNTVTFSFSVLGEFIDTNIHENDLWDFDEEEYISNVVLSATSDDLSFDIVNDLPADTNQIGISGGALLLDLKANETYDITLKNGKSLLVADASNLGFKIYTENVIDIFEIYNVEDGTYYDMSWKVTKCNIWHTVEFACQSLFLEDYSLTSIRFVIGCEEDTKVYIDSIYYTDYIEPWIDEDLDSASGCLAIFDDVNYMERVSNASSTDYTTFNTSYSVITKDEVSETSDLTGGVLKLVSSTDIITASDKQSRDGFSFTFFKRLSFEDIEGLSLRIYCVDRFSVVSINFYDAKKGETTFAWQSLDSSVQGNWVTVYFSQELLSTIITKGYDNLSSMTVRFHRNSSCAVEGQTNYTVYLDSINLFSSTVDYSKIEYSFSNEYDYRVVSKYNGGTFLRYPDETVSDGYVLKATSSYNATKDSGVQVLFNNLLVADYYKINLVIKTNNGIDIFANEIYLKYGTFSSYTTIDVKPLLVEKGITVLSSLEFGRKSVNGVEIYLDCIELIPFETYNYDFSSSTDNDKNAVSSYGNGTIIGIVEDENATDGFALKSTKTNGAGGITIGFSTPITVAEYTSIVLRIRTTGDKPFYIYYNGVTAYVRNCPNNGEYLEIELKEYVESETISSITIKNDFSESGEVFVDSIVFTNN